MPVRRRLLLALLGIAAVGLLAAKGTEDDLVLVSQAPGRGAPVWHPGGSHMALGGHGGIGIWDLDTGHALGRIAPDYRIGAMAWTRGGEGIVGVLARVGGIHEWEVRSGALSRTLQSANAMFTGTRLEALAAGSRLLIRGRQTSLHDARDGSELFHVRSHLLEPSPDGLRAVVRSLQDYQLVDGRTGELLAVLGEPAPPYGTDRQGWRPRPSNLLVAWSIDAEVVALWPKARHKTVAETIELYDGRTGEDRGELTFEPQELFGVLFGPDDRTLIAWNDERVDRWDLGAGTRDTLVEGDVQDVVWSPDRSTLAVLRARYEIPGRAPVSAAEDPTRIELWRPGEESPVLLPGAGVCVPGGGGLSWSPDGRLLVRYGQSGEREIWDVPGRRLHGIVDGGGWAVRDSVFSPDGTRIAVQVDREQVHVWDLTRGSLEGVFDVGEYPVFSMAWSPDGKWLAVGAEGVSIWDPARDRVRHQLDLEIPPVHPDTRSYGGELYVAARLLAWSPDGRTLATVRQHDKSIALWDVRSGEYLRSLGPGSQEDPADAPGGHLAGLNGIAFSPDGRYLASTAQEKRALIWELEQAADGGDVRPVGVTPLEGVGYRPLWLDETRVVLHGTPGLHVVDAETRNTLRILPIRDRTVDALSPAPTGDDLLFVDRPRKEARTPEVVRIDGELGGTRRVGALPGFGWDASIHPQGDLIAYGGEGLVLHSLSSGATIHLRAARVDGEWATLSWTPDGRFDGDPRMFDEMLYADPNGDLLERPLIAGSQVADRFHVPGLFVAEGFGEADKSP